MEHAQARVKRHLMKAIAYDLKNLAAAQEMHKEVASMLLRERGVFPDKKGYESTTLLLRATRAIRDLDNAAAEKIVKEWKQCAREQMDAQLFDTSARCSFNALTAELTMGTDEATRVLGESIKEWSEKLDKYVVAVRFLSM